jgi:uncharacterized membrane protein HdeD (DUF308 family)
MFVSDTHPPVGASPQAPLRERSGWIVALGVVYVLAGIAALASVTLAAVVTVFVVGIMMVVAGVAEVLSAIRMRSWRKSVFWMLLGALYILAGIFTFENPLLTAKFLTLLLGLFLIGSGVMKIVLAVSIGAGSSGALVILSGVFTLAVGAIILIHWPVSSLIVLAVFLGVDLVSTGIGWIATGLGLKRGS